MIPTPSLETWTTIGRLAGDHLWQSTLFAAAAALLTLTVRRNRAQVRHALWLAASAKFLIPFAVLVSIGSLLGWRSPASTVQPGVTFVMDASQPFSRHGLSLSAAALPAVSRTVVHTLPLGLLAIWLTGFALILAAWWRQWRHIAAVVRSASPVEFGRELDTLRRLETTGGIRKPVALVSSQSCLEPGVFGIAKPVLLWPQTISAHLDDRQVEAIIAHEVLHVRHRDNLVAAFHMFVEAVFWFHPVVWWVGARLIDERERACDEDVIRLGSEPRVYAESIVKACQVYVASPLPCMAGVTGSDLTRRIERIMKNHQTDRLASWRKFLLTAMAAGSVAAPIAIGALHAPRLRAQSPQAAPDGPTFEVASVKLNTSGDRRVFMQNQPGRFIATNVTLRMLIRNAYQLQEFQISGGPGWIGSDHFDIVAKIEADAQEPLAGGQAGTGPTRLQLMMRSLLAERFKLTVHNETKDSQIYALVVARSDGRLGPELHRSETDCAALVDAARGRGAPPLPPPPGSPMPCGIRVGIGNLAVGGAPLSQVASSLSMFVGRVVLDRTGLTGPFDIDLTWTPDQMPQRPPGAPDLPVDPNGPSIFTALQEQLGLKLESQRGPVEMLVIDRAEHPAEN
jgi:bla regulator protein BlaR1